MQFRNAGLEEVNNGITIQTLIFNPLTNQSNVKEWIFIPGSLKENQFLVKVKTVSLNKLDNQLRTIRKLDKRDINYGVGCEFSGIVIDCGNITLCMIEKFSIGDYVCGLIHCDNPRSEGALATHAIVDLTTDIILKTPIIRDPCRSCSWIYSYLYAKELLSKLPIIRKTMIVFINGGNTDIGIMIIQMLRKIYGVKLVIIADTSNRIDFITKKQISCEVVINGDQENICQTLTQDFDLAMKLSRKSLAGDENDTHCKLLDSYHSKFDVIIDLIGNDVLMFSSKDYLLSKTNGGIYIRQTGYKGIDKNFYNGLLQTYLWNSDFNYVNVEFPLSKINNKELIKMRDNISQGIINPIVAHKNRIKGLKSYLSGLDKVTDRYTIGSTVMIVDNLYIN